MSKIIAQNIKHANEAVLFFTEWNFQNIKNRPSSFNEGLWPIVVRVAVWVLPLRKRDDEAGVLAVDVEHACAEDLPQIVDVVSRHAHLERGRELEIFDLRFPRLVVEDALRELLHHSLERGLFFPSVKTIRS